MAERVGRSLPGGTLLERAGRVPGAVWVVVLVAAAIVVGIVVAVVAHSSNPLTVHILGGFRSDDPHAFTITYEVTKNPQSTSECEIDVQDENHDKVGSIVDTVGPTDNNVKTTRKQLVIPTSAQGVTAIVDRCHLLHT